MWFEHIRIRSLNLFRKGARGRDNPRLQVADNRGLLARDIVAIAHVQARGPRALPAVPAPYRNAYPRIACLASACSSSRRW